MFVLHLIQYYLPFVFTLRLTYLPLFLFLFFFYPLLSPFSLSSSAPVFSLSPTPTSSSNSSPPPKTRSLPPPLSHLFLCIVFHTCNFLLITHPTLISSPLLFLCLFFFLLVLSLQKDSKYRSECISAPQKCACGPDHTRSDLDGSASSPWKIGDKEGIAYKS